VTYLSDPRPPVVQVGRFHVPGRMTASIQHASLPVTVELALEVDYTTRAVRCWRFNCTETSTPKGVTGEKLRKLPVERIIRSVLAAAAEDVQGWSLDWTNSEADFLQAVTIGNPAARRAMTPEHLTEVARVYRKAVASRLPAPVQEVADHFGRPRSTAARWVQKARAQGLLGKTNRGRAGEHNMKQGSRR